MEICQQYNTSLRLIIIAFDKFLCLIVLGLWRDYRLR